MPKPEFIYFRGALISIWEKFLTVESEIGVVMNFKVAGENTFVPRAWPDVGDDLEVKYLDKMHHHEAIGDYFIARRVIDLTTGRTGNPSVFIPSLYAYGTGTVPCREEYLGLCTELSLLAPTQYSNYNFDSMCKFGDVYLGCNELGIFTLDGETDNNIHIAALFELLLTDFGVPNQKRIRKVYLGYEASGSLVLEIKDDDDNTRRYTVEAALANQRQHGARVPVGRDGKGRYWTFGVENVEGCDFSLDSMDVLVTVLGKKSGKVSTSTGRMLLPALTIRPGMING